MSLRNFLQRHKRYPLKISGNIKHGNFKLISLTEKKYVAPSVYQHNNYTSKMLTCQLGCTSPEPEKDAIIKDQMSVVNARKGPTYWPKLSFYS
jgi:hypothetical protein